MQGDFWVVRNEEQRSKVLAQLAEVPIGKGLGIQAKPYKAPKTNPQIDYAHSMIRKIAKAKKRQFEEVKVDAKREWGVINVSTSSITGDRAARLKSLADYSKEEMIGFIGACEAYCSEHGYLNEAKA
jgi:hypothetical protein